MVYQKLQKTSRCFFHFKGYEITTRQITKRHFFNFRRFWTYYRPIVHLTHSRLAVVILLVLLRFFDIRTAISRLMEMFSDCLGRSNQGGVKILFYLSIPLL